MRILVADNSGHPFQAQLSRSLAVRGYDVLHMFSASFETPKGDLQRRETDPPTLQFAGVELAGRIDKHNPLARRAQDVRTALRYNEIIEEFRPEVSIMSNQPIDTLERIVPTLKKIDSSFIFWAQDLYGEAISRIFRSKWFGIGSLIGKHYTRREGKLLRLADQIVAISSDFLPILTRKLGVDARRITVIENWAPLEDIPILERDNSWANANMPVSGFRIVYSGTLGAKHDPNALIELAVGVENCHLIVFSQGRGAQSIADSAKERGLVNVSVRDWLDFSDLPNALAGADLLVVLLEPDAGVFSVPSKVLTYLCTGRPILGSINANNLAAKIIGGAGAGITCQPGDYSALVAAARHLTSDREAARAAGTAARRYAESTFDIETITDKFVKVIRKSTRR